MNGSRSGGLWWFAMGGALLMGVLGMLRGMIPEGEGFSLAPDIARSAEARRIHGLRTPASPFLTVNRRELVTKIPPDQ